VNDIAEIWTFGFQRWGEIQADRYAQQLATLIHKLTEFPELGAPLLGKTSGVRSLKSGKHRIIYALPANNVRVVRILHASRDFARHLP
jgi:toxin ParE1/3/4